MTAIETPGPVAVMTSTGQLVVLPASTLTFAQGQVTSHNPLYVSHQADIEPYLAYLVAQGLIRPSPAPPPRPAIIVEAKSPGSAGNDIALTISNVGPDPADAAKTVFDAELTQTDVYPELPSGDDTLEQLIGTDTAPGTRPGLVELTSSGTPTTPAAGSITPTDFVVEVPDEAGDAAFELTFRIQDPQAQQSVTIADVDRAASTFTMTANWAKAVTGIHPDELESSFADHLTVRAPDGGAITTAPAAGTYRLAGGSDTAPANPASATLVG